MTQNTKIQKNQIKNTFTKLWQDILPIPPNERRWLGCLHGAAESLVLAELTSAHNSLVVMLAKDASHLYQLEAELEFFGAEVHVFADWETLPYDQLSPNQGIVSERLRLLSRMPTSGVLLLTASTALSRIAPPSWLLGQHFDLKVGDTLDLEHETLRLTKAGYRATQAVYEAGEFAVRGSLMDIFPMGQRNPLRIELFDDEIESIRLFDAQTQRSLQAKDDSHDKPKKLSEFRVLSAHEFPLIDGKETFRNRFTESFPEVSARKVALYDDVMNGIAPQGLEYYLPLFFDHDELVEQGHVFSYLPKNALIVQNDALDASLSHFWDELERRYRDLSADTERPILPPQALYMDAERLSGLTKGFGRLHLSEADAPKRAGATDLPFEPLPDVSASHKAAKPLEKLNALLGHNIRGHGVRAAFAVESPSRREVLSDLLTHHTGKPKQVADFLEFLGSDSQICMSLAVLDRALYAPSQFAIITENQLFGHEVVRTRKRASAQVSDEYLVKSITELNVGDPVVHIDHGIGRYGGLTMLTLDDEPDEFLQINYADDAAVYVPVANLHLISRYSGGNPASAPLHRIGSDQWRKAKKKALDKIHDVAAELLDVQARRDARPGISFKVDDTAYDLFASEFAFEETPDQDLAITSVLFDMKQNKPMDRLVCGDVGFGKTEVAMRAAFVAVQAGHQVAVLVPTTLLAEQHEDNFKNRFADWPMRVEAVSRFGAKKKVAKILEDTAAGKVDILIGTHKLLQDDVAFANLGLMIVDEEHRFGVRHKEKIKSMRSDVDMLTLTATPIPRTLNMSLSGMRDLSIIATPPSRRLPIKTFVLKKTDALLKEAILRELLRGGQVYYLHNDIASIERTAENIRELIPEARAVVAHGQMKGSQLERVMEDFYHKKFNVLVCTTIIETGIDIANANTIIIERADKFGLAQLHQLRGRVGRSFHQAYAYMLVPSVKGLKGDAKKRLDAIQRANTLGAGFLLASEDLEIRGAGELLGSEQSGNMQAIGFSLYMDMLERTTKAMKAAAKNSDNCDDLSILNAPLSLTSDINLHFSALIPDDYLPDVRQRLLFYKRISSAKDTGGLLKLRIEMLDRFGMLPEATERLFEVHKIRFMTEPLAITKLDIGAGGGKLEFAQHTPVDAMKIITLLQKHPKRYRMDGAQGLRVIDDKDFATPEKRIESVKKLLEAFG